MEGSGPVLAVPSIGTGGTAALIHVFLTPGTGESWQGRGWEGTVFTVMQGGAAGAKVSLLRRLKVDGRRATEAIHKEWSSAPAGCEALGCGQATQLPSRSHFFLCRVRE